MSPEQNMQRLERLERKIEQLESRLSDVELDQNHVLHRLEDFPVQRWDDLEDCEEDYDT